MIHFSYFDVVLILVFLSLDFWPVSLVVGAMAAAWSLQVRGAGRAVLIGLAVLCALHALGGVAVWYDRRLGQARSVADNAERDAEYQRTHRALAEPETIEGLTLPTGTEVGWTDAGHTRLHEFELPGPTLLLGAMLEWRATDEQGAWTVKLAATSTIDGWSCKADYNVRISRQGHLISCQLASSRAWHGRLVPAGTHVEPDQDAVSLHLPSDDPVTLPDLRLIARNDLILNSDGSVHMAYVEPKDNFAVHGIPLWNIVTFRYSKADRYAAAGIATVPLYPVPLSVNGALSRDTVIKGEAVGSGTMVTVQWMGGAATIDERICGPLSPLPDTKPCRNYQ